MSDDFQHTRPDYGPGEDGTYPPHHGHSPDGQQPPYEHQTRYDPRKPQDVGQPPPDEKTLAILAHLSGPIAAVLSVGLLGFLGPLVVWLVYKDNSPFLRHAAAGAFNFNVSMFIINSVGWVCVFSIILFPIGAVLITVYWVMLLVCHIVAAVRANKGLVYRYPLQLPILS